MLLKNKVIKILLITLVGCSSFIGSRGKLVKPTKNKSVGIVAFRVFSSSGEDITNKCLIGYGEDGRSPSIHLKNGTTHFLEFSEKLKVKMLICFPSFRAYEFEFDAFEYLGINSKAYNLGKYTLEYDYNKNYEDTRFYQAIKKCEYPNYESCKTPKHKYNQGIVRLIKHEALSFELLEKKIPGHNKEQIRVNQHLGKNIDFNLD